LTTIPFPDERIIVGTNVGVFISNQSGDFSASTNSGLTDTNVQVVSASINQRFIFAGTNTGIWRYHYTLITDGILPGNRRFKTRNSGTSVWFQVSTPSHVALYAHTLSGEKVATLFSENMKAGDHVRNLSTGALTGGVYIYSLHIGEAVERARIWVSP
jgi:hypothetical protein